MGKGNERYTQNILEVLGDDELTSEQILARLKKRQLRRRKERVATARWIPTDHELPSIIAASPLFERVNPPSKSLAIWRKRG